MNRKPKSINEAAAEATHDRSSQVWFNDILIRPKATDEETVQAYYLRREEVAALYAKLSEGAGDVESAIVEYFAAQRKVAQPGDESSEAWCAFHEVVSFHQDKQRSNLQSRLLSLENRAMPTDVMADDLFCLRR